MTKLKYYDVIVGNRRQAVYLKGDVDEHVDLLEAENDALCRVLRSIGYSDDDINFLVRAHLEEIEAN